MIISITNQKGGVGKTTISTNSAYALAKLGKKTLLVDMDSQANASIIFYDVKRGKEKKEKNVNDLLSHKKQNIVETIYPATMRKVKIENLFILPSSIHLATIDQLITTRIHKETILSKHLQKIREQFDFILIDSPPNLGNLSINAINAADLIIIPTNYSKYALDGISDLFDTIEQIKGNHYNYRILRNVFDKRNVNTNEFVDNELIPYEKNLFKTIIRKCESINQSQINEEIIFTYDPQSNGSIDFNSLSKEIAGYYYG